VRRLREPAAALKERAKTLQIKHDGTRDSGGNLRKACVDDPNPMTARATASGGDPRPRHRQAGAVPRPAPARLRHGPAARRVREAARRAVEARHRPENNVYEHRWQVGDVLIWSNYSTMHRRDEFDKNTIRRMHRSQIKGTAAPAAYFA
jgi:taurine dioxygenase